MGDSSLGNKARFDKFIDIKNFLFDNKDIYMDESYFPNKIFNIDSFPIAVIINFFIYNFLYSFFSNKKSCLELRENIFEFGSSNKELAIIFNLYMIPLFVSFFIFGVFDLVNTSKIINTYGNLLSNWKFHPIKSISSEIKEEEKINYSKYFSSGRNKNSIEWKNIILNLERFDDYDYFNIYSNKTGRICGKDNFGNNLYFPKDVDCPINEIFISQYYLYTTDYDQIKISDNEYLYYTNQNTQGNIIIDLGVNSNLEELNSDYTFPLYEDIYYENNSNQSFLYSTNYIGLNLSSFTEKESEKINDFRNNFDKYESFYDCKIAFIAIDNFFIILYSSLVFKRECGRDTCCTFFTIILFSAIKIIYFIISIINFLFQKEYINGFLYKINYDFSLKKRNLDFDIIIIIYSIILLSFSILTFLMTCFYIKLFELKKEKKEKKEKDNPNETRINNEKPAIKDDTSEISLKTKMNEMKDEIKEKEEEINELNENITNLNEKNEKILNEKNNEIEKLNDTVKQLNIELNNEKTKSEKLKKDLTKLKENSDQILSSIGEKERIMNKLKENLGFEIKEDENLMCVIFQCTDDQEIHYPIICKDKQIFNSLENKLYEKYTKYKESENFFFSEAKKINKLKTLKENNIKNGQIIFMTKMVE